MKNFIFIIMLLLLLNNVIFSQQPNNGFTGSFGIGLGGRLEGSGYDDYEGLGSSLGFCFSAAGGYIFNNNFGARVDMQYNIFPAYYVTIFSGPSPSGGDAYIFALKTDLSVGDFRKHSKFIPFGVLGIGMYVISKSDKVTSGYPTVSYPTKAFFGMGAGAGLGFKLNKNLSIFCEGQYNVIFREETSTAYIPVKIGLLFFVF